MGYNINEVSGATTGGPSLWTQTLDLTDPGATMVTGDFDAGPTSGGSSGEAPGGYSFSGLSNPGFGTLVTNSSTGEYTFLVDRGAVIASNSDQVVSFTVTGSNGFFSNTDTVEITVLVCVARGTMIDTPNGPRPVQDIAVGDLVATLDGPARPVRWIGARRVTADDLDQDPSLRPVRIGKGALGAKTPSRDLLVSPQHRIYLTDWRTELLFAEPQVLVPAKSLLNDRTITLAHDVDEVEYFHLLFDTHEVIFTEGAPTESFFPGDHTLSAFDEQVRAELLSLFPDLCSDKGFGPSARPSLRHWEARVLTVDQT
ncbi:Hint domain-containing protein [Nioella nitratireducens]|uniref:Hint domain-containing protein n=1 Tax=Nioella nitratireducens TaxID=1287720 RepID=UPI000A002948|nr:Hint domain-containing protein [Nioella nitratireducens]